MLLNALHGFHSMSAPFGLDETRLKAAVGLVRRWRPDILGINEACYGGPNPFREPMAYGQLFGFHHSYFAPWGRYEWGNVLLSKWPMTATKKQLGRRTAIQAEVTVGPIDPLNFWLVHLDPEENDRRKKWFLEKLLPEDPRRTIVFGDFNSTPTDGALIPYLSTNLVDAVRAREQPSRPTAPTSNYVRPGRPPARVDYVFVSSDLRVARATTVDGPAAEVASDHYSLLIDVKV